MIKKFLVVFFLLLILVVCGGGVNFNSLSLSLGVLELI